MAVNVAMVSVLVDEYGRGIGFFRDVLGMEVVEDTDMGGGKRWVVMGGRGGARLLIARANDSEQRTAMGRQAGGRVGFFLETDDFEADHARMREAGVAFEESPRREAYGTVAVFRDPFGNKWDLIQPQSREIK